MFDVHFSDDKFVAAPEIDFMETRALPAKPMMVSAFFGRDAAFDGVFYTGVTTTGIFCRPSCPARKPNAENIEFFATAREALVAGYRPCKRCRPLKPAGHPPEWLQSLLDV
ncbi:MAG: Ada metal-binding domain-containing protein, partial [Rhodothermia bacterium]